MSAATDQIHRDRGDVMCWCSTWVRADETIDGTCGAAPCLAAESLDRQGRVP